MSDEKFTTAGPLFVESLGSDAWEKWCKDGVVCFGFTSSREYEDEEEERLLKIYVANPRDQSVYHVIDFEIGPKDSPRFILVGSTIYLLLGCPDPYSYSCGYGSVDAHYSDLHYCDLRLPGPGGAGYEWKLGPKLNSHKHRPLLFSLSGNLYVLSTGAVESNCEPFEFLNLMKPDSADDKWEVLPCPDYLLPEHTIYGSLVFEDDFKNISKFLFQSYCYSAKRSEAFSFHIYDALLNKWSRLIDQPVPNLDISKIYGTVDDIGLLLGRQRSPSASFVVSPNLSDHQTFEHRLLEPIGLDLDAVLGFTPNSIDTWHLLSFGTSGYCLIAFCSAHEENDSVSVRIGTFDWLPQSDVSIPRRLRSSTNDVSKYYLRPCAPRSQPKLKTINVAEDDDLEPCHCCSISGL